jgi:hypothetical protein
MPKNGGKKVQENGGQGTGSQGYIPGEKGL